MSRRRLTRGRWRKLVEQQRNSGLSVPAFCARQGVGTSTFFAWRRRLGRGRQRAFVELRAKGQEASASSGPIEVLLGSGVTLRVREGFDAATLRQVVEALS